MAVHESTRLEASGVGMLRGVHLLAILAIVLGATALRATEFYALHYQSLAVQDWLESRPPLDESSKVPASGALVRGLALTTPLLEIRDDVRPRLTVFGPPAIVQRTIGGVRDASSILLGSPGVLASDRIPVQIHLDVVVFNRALRAAAWADLMSRVMDVRDPGNGLYQARVSGPDEPDGVWVLQPREIGAVATVVGHRNSVGFVLQATLAAPTSQDPAVVGDANARAESTARQAAADWSAWLAQQLNA